MGKYETGSLVSCDNCGKDQEISRVEKTTLISVRKPSQAAMRRKFR